MNLASSINSRKWSVINNCQVFGHGGLLLDLNCRLCHQGLIVRLWDSKCPIANTQGRSFLLPIGFGGIE